MPLKPGKKNIGKNIKTEMSHGKSKAQSIAIAYSVKEKAEKESKKVQKKEGKKGEQKEKKAK